MTSPFPPLREHVAAVLQQADAWDYLWTWEREARRAAHALAMYGPRAKALREALGNAVPSEKDADA